MALLARGAEPIAVRRALPGDAGDTQARYLEAAIGGILFASIYLPNGNPAARAEVRLQARLVRAPDRPRRVAAGERPSGGAGRRLQRRADRRRHLPDHLVPRQRAAAAGAARGLRAPAAQGWTDAIRARHPEAPIYTFWDYLRNRWPRNAGLRIDHLLLSESLAGRLREAEVDREERGREGASDHAPVWARLAAKRATRRAA